MGKIFIAGLGVAAVVGGGYYFLNSTGNYPNVIGPTGPAPSSNSNPVASGGGSCGNWPSVDPYGMAQAMSFSGSTPPPAFYSDLPIPSQTKFIGGSHRDRQPIVLTAADADKGPRGLGTYFFCSDLSVEQVFAYLKANKGTYKVENPSSAGEVAGLTLSRVVTGGQDYFANVAIQAAGGKTLITFVLSTFF